MYNHFMVCACIPKRSRNFTLFYASAASARRGHRAFGLSVRVYIRTSVDQVKIYVQGRILKPIYGSKLIFHKSMYLYETNRNIQEPWPHDLYFMVHWLRTSARLSRLRFCPRWILSSTNGSKLIFHIRIYLCETSRNIQDLMTYISLSANFRLWPIFHGHDFCY